MGTRQEGRLITLSGLTWLLVLASEGGSLPERMMS